MKNDTQEYYTWDDVVFENRNKSYGAYLVRQSYSRNSMIAFGASVSFAIVLLFLPQIINRITGGDVKLPVIMDSRPLEKMVELIQPPLIETLVVPPAASQPAPSPAPPRVVTHETTDVIPTNTEIKNLQPSVDSGEGVTFVESPVEIAPVEVVTAPPSGPLNIAEEMPEYIGGRAAMMKLFSRNFKYPRSASSMGIEGTVYVGFVIDSHGNVTDVNIVRGVSAECDKEALRLISLMPAWKAGMQNHQPVAVRMVLPVKFEIN